MFMRTRFLLDGITCCRRLLGDDFFFYKQNTAYAVRLSRVGPEMCVRDSTGPMRSSTRHAALRAAARLALPFTLAGCGATAVAYTHLTPPTNREGVDPAGGDPVQKNGSYYDYTVIAR